MNAYICIFSQHAHLAHISSIIPSGWSVSIFMLFLSDAKTFQSELWASRWPSSQNCTLIISFIFCLYSFPALGEEMMYCNTALSTWQVKGPTVTLSCFFQCFRRAFNTGRVFMIVWLSSSLSKLTNIGVNFPFFPSWPSLVLCLCQWATGNVCKWVGGSEGCLSTQLVQN